MNKVLKFSKFSKRRVLIQYIVSFILIALLSLYIFDKVSLLLNERRMDLLSKYKEQVDILLEDKKENLRKIEREYDEKIYRLQEKIEDLEKKIK